MEADEWDHRYASTDLLWSAGPNRFVAAELEGLPPGAALDVGAGEGRNAVWLAAEGWRVHAVDFSQVALDRGKKLAEARGVEVEWEQADLREWTPPEASYDLVLLCYLHLPWALMRRVLRASADAVAPGGLFLLVGHDRTNLDEGVGGPPDPDVLYTPAQITAELDGFEIERATVLKRPVQTDGEDREAIDNLVRAVRRCDA